MRRAGESQPDRLKKINIEISNPSLAPFSKHSDNEFTSGGILGIA